MNDQDFTNASFDDIYTALSAGLKHLIQRHKPRDGMKTVWTTMGLSIVAEREPNDNGVPEDAITVSYRILEPRIEGWHVDVHAVWWAGELFRPNTHVDIECFGMDAGFPAQPDDRIARMALRYLLTL